MDFLGVTQRWQKTKLFSLATQLASDFLYRYWQKSAMELHKDLSQQPFRSLELIVDASPKGKLDVWSPIGYAGRVAAALPLQRLSALAVSTVSVQTKLEEGQKIVDKFAETAAGEKHANLKKMHLGSTQTRPKAISKIRQKKLSAREQMRACMHVLSVLDLELLVGDQVFRPLDTTRGEKRMLEDGKAWLWDPATGEASWDCLTPRHQSHLRLILAPDEGSTLWSAFTFLAGKNFKVNFVRDELPLHKLQNHYLRLFQCNKAVKRTWALSEWLMKAKRGPWAHSGDLLQELFASSILAENGWDPNAEGLHAFENVCEEGINPFADMGVAATGDDGQKYNRIMDCCIRALVDEEAHKLFESLQFFTEPWCEMCQWLEGLGPQGMAFATTGADLNVDGLSSEAEASKLKVLRVVNRRCRVQQDLLRDHLDICLLNLYELGSYQLYLSSAPASSACLSLKESATVPDVKAVQARVLTDMENEWATVLNMEQQKSTGELLHKLCPHVLWQVYRESMVAVEADAFKLTQTVRDLVLGWYPRLSFSANVEDQFAAMQDSVRRGSKGGSAGITNLNTVGVKALYSKLLDGDNQATSVKLQDSDWEGTTVRALKQKLFQPESFTGSSDVHLDSILTGASGTSAHQHNKGTLNYMRAFLEAVKLREIELYFEGKLPPETVDENSIAKNPARWEAEDVLDAILKLDAVKNCISEQDAEDIVNKCDDMDAKRRSRSANAEQDEDEDEEQPEAFDMNGEPDPALAAANELLALIGDDDDEEEPTGPPQAPEAAAAEEPPAAENGNAAGSGENEAVRESRRLLSSASAIPKHLTDRWPVMDGVSIAHTVHRDQTRPLFQARLLTGKFANKGSCSASYNGELQKDVVDLAKTVQQILFGFYFDPKAANQEAQLRVYEYFGTFTRSLLSLFELTLANWPPVCRLLVEEVSEWWLLMCLLHKLTMGFAVIGVINAVLMQETFKVAYLDDTVMVREKMRTMRAHVAKMSELFHEADTSGDGKLDFEEFKQILKKHEVKVWLSAMELDVSNVKELFTMLDTGGDGRLSADELVQGVSRLRGSGRAQDVRKILEMSEQMKHDLRELHVATGIRRYHTAAHTGSGDFEDSLAENKQVVTVNC
ncbi:unnamed protein product [Symbiodinium sp. CCMP2592]|nr:unnamed protein product [Symbiodinium sp. CCMP2592]